MNPYRQRAAHGLLLLLASCSSNASDSPAPVGQEDISNVIYVGGATDEALKRLLDVAPKNDAKHVVIIDSPDLKAPVPKDSPATLQFHLVGETTRAPGLRPRPAGPPPSKWQRSFHELLELLAPERIAHAHGTPYNGTAYYLVITGADSKQILQLFTAQTSFTPEAVDWQNLVQAPQPLTLDVTSAFFDENDIPAGEGPFVGGSFQFRIE